MRMHRLRHRDWWLDNEAVMDCMATRLVIRPEVMDRRRETVEHPFGSIKQWMNQGAFLMRRLENVCNHVQNHTMPRRDNYLMGPGPRSGW